LQISAGNLLGGGAFFFARSLPLGFNAVLSDVWRVPARRSTKNRAMKEHFIVDYYNSGYLSHLTR